MAQGDDTAIRQAVDRSEIYQVMCRYARGVDRGDADIIRSVYHPDAEDDHIDYKGGVEGFIAWLAKNFAGYDNSMHFLGNCMVEFAGSDTAFVETSYASRRLRPPSDKEKAAGMGPQDMICRQSWGRYLDRFERRNGEWRIARRQLAIEGRFSTVALKGARSGEVPWGTRDASDPLYAARARVLGG